VTPSFRTSRRIRFCRIELISTGEVAKKIIGGAADVIGNITGEIKQGVGAK